tara:strand:+ start:24003 stop:25031 length:1029 start_codon:yes stop_codon:yes gene_type:complete
MKAIVLHEFGGIEKLLYQDIETPKPGPGQVLVKIHASGINHLDHDLREGISGIDLNFPHVIGVEGAGEVAELGDGSNRFSIGDRVAIHFAQGDPTSDMWLSGLDGVDFTHGRIGASRWGTHAEFCVVEETSLITIPTNISYEKAAASIIGLGTAWHMTVNLGQIQAGQKILINAAGSVVGSSAIQVAKLHGAHIIATVGSEQKMSKAKDIGADVVLNYSSDNIFESIQDITNGKGVDLVIESVGGDIFAQSVKSVCLNGRLVTCGAHAGETVPINIIELFRKHMMIHGSHLAGRKEIRHILGLIADDQLTPVIDSTFPLSKIVEAAKKTANRDVFGKMLLLP